MLARTLRLRLLGVLVGLATVFGLSIAAPPAPAGAVTVWNPSLSSDTYLGKDAPCTDLLYIGVRGSAEHSQFGNTLNVVMSNFKSRLNADVANATVTPVYIDYPAVSTNWLFFDALVGGFMPATYTTSVAAGVTTLNSVLSHSVADCPNQKWVLTGYSQGGEVVDQVLHNTIYLSRVVGVGLVGDAGNYPGKPVNLVGNKPNPNGQGVYDSLLVRYEYPSSLKGSTWSLCSAGDAICDWKVASAGAAIHKVASGIHIHGSYKTDSNLASWFQPLADEVASKYQPKAASLISDPRLEACVLDTYNSDHGTQLTDITQAQLATMTTIFCQRNGITDLSGLQYATSLTGVWLTEMEGGPQPANISVLAGLPDLSVVGIDNVSDLTPFSGLTHLTQLYLEQGTYVDLKPLSGLTNLTVLALQSGEHNDLTVTPDAGFSDITPVASLPNLIQLGLDAPQLRDFSPLANYASRGVLLSVGAISKLPSASSGVAYQLPKVIAPDGTVVVPTLSSGAVGTVAPDGSSITWDASMAGKQAGLIYQFGNVRTTLYVVLGQPIT